MNSIARKRGRPRKPFIAADGSSVNGLRRRGNGRWVIIDTAETFREPDERLAIARFKRWEASKNGTPYVALPVADGVPLDLDVGTRATAGVTGSPIGPYCEDWPTAPHWVDEPSLWTYVREQIISRPAWVAQQVGIEQIAYLDQIKRAEPAPTLEDVGRLFFTKSLSANWRAKCKAAWEEFKQAVAAQTLRDLTQEHVLQYGELVQESSREAARAPTYVRQRFQAVKSIVNYPPDRGRWAEDCKRVFAFMSVLQPPAQSAADPRPITRPDFRTLLGKADATMHAMLLMSLNCCMYAGEVAALDWTDINFQATALITRRPKTGVVRVAMLWPETVAALRQLPADDGPPFRTKTTRMQHTYQSAYKAFKALRTEAQLPSVQFSQIRDGAYTAAVQAGTDLNSCKLLAGHATGIPDRYVKRGPQMVAAACDAIRHAYM